MFFEKILFGKSVFFRIVYFNQFLNKPKKSNTIPKETIRFNIVHFKAFF